MNPLDLAKRLLQARDTRIAIPSLCREGLQLTLDDAYQILAATRSLFKSNPEDPAFGAKYRDCLQREPAAVMAHADVQKVLFADS